MLAVLVVHALLALRFPLAGDETYYWEWSRHPALGYYDQGPMVAWWIRGSCAVLGDTVLGIRFSIVLASFLTQVCVYLLTRDLFNPRTAFVALIASTLTPLALVGSFIATYDPLVVLFWAAAALFGARAIFFESRVAWVGLGIAFGLGLLSKHTMAFFAFALVFFLAVSPDHRKWLSRPEPYLALFLALIVMFPNLWWQSRHDWVTFKHLFLLTGKGLDQPLPRRFGDFLGSQVGLMTPLLFVAMAASMIWALRRAGSKDGERPWYLCALSAPILLLFLAMTMKSKVQANWAVCGWVTAPSLWAAWLNSRSENEVGWEGVRRLFRGPFTRLTLVFSAALTILLATPEIRPLLHLSIPPKWDTQMNKLYGGAELGAAVAAVRQQMEEEGAGPVTIGSVTYDNASRVGFYTPGKPNPYCLFLGTRMNSFALWQEPYRPKPGGSALLADDRPPSDPDRVRYEGIFERVEPVEEPVLVWRRGIYVEPVHRYYLYRCYGYRPNPEAETPRGG